MPEPSTRHVGPRRSGPDSSSAPQRRCPTCGSQYPIDFKVCPKDTTPLERPEVADEDPLIGEVLANSFCITGILGEGGMGKVYEAEHVRLPKRFAIKVMLDELVRHPDALARFEREAQAVARISNEHVIEIVDLVRLKDGRPCLVSELLEGQELGILLEQEGRMSVDMTVAIARQVCRGLAAAHAVGIIHRDLKPSNLFLLRRSDGRPFVKILDFGVAKLQDGAELTRTGMIVGTPAYMSPEQARGSNSVDERADVYSLGAVIYRMLTGVPPFDGEDPAFILTKVLTEDPERPRTHNRSIPDGLEHLIQRAMAREASERPKSVRDLERELAMFDDGSHSPPSGPVSIHREPTSALALATLPTIVAPIASSSPAAIAEVSKRSRFARPSAVIFAGLASIVAGLSATSSATAALRTYVTRGALKDTHLLVLGAVGGGVAILSLAAIGQPLLSRWRNTPAMERLGDGLRSAVLAMLVPAGLAALVWTIVVTFGLKLDNDEALMAQFAMASLPLALGMAAFGLALRRATKVG